jgi:uncharacterized protein
VVDACAKAYVHLLDGIASYVTGNPLTEVPEPSAWDAESPAAAAQAEYAHEEQFRFCTEALVRGASLPSSDRVRQVLRERGDSLVVIRSGEILKVHIHTDEPDGVFAYLRGVGHLVTHRAEDMEAQHATVGRAAQGHVRLARRPVSILTDSAHDLPREVVLAHGIHVVPLSLIYGERTLRDGVDITAESFTERLLRGEHPSTSQPPPAAFLEGFRSAAEDGEQVLALILSGALSGTLASAEAAARLWSSSPDDRAHGSAPVRLVDSRGASLLQGLLTLKAAELAELGRPVEEIAAEVQRIRDQSGVFFTVDTFDRLLASGRVGRGRAWLGTLLDIKPILELNREGRVVPLDRVRGRRNLLPRLMDLLRERVPPGTRQVRFGVVHVAADEVVDEVTAALQLQYGEDVEIITNRATAVIATHTGPGAWGLAYMVED